MHNYIFYIKILTIGPNKKPSLLFSDNLILMSGIFNWLTVWADLSIFPCVTLHKIIKMVN